MLGISVYFKDLNYEYLIEAKKLGAKYLFTSLHLPEEDLSNLENELPKFLEVVNELGYYLIPDISPSTFEKLKLSPNDYKGLKALGFKVLRLDYGFDDFNLIKTLQKDFEIVLNASTINEKYILDAIAEDIDLSKIKLMHNFYPKTDTGLPRNHFSKLNTTFLKHNLEVMAFIPGDKLRRFPLYEGLPTIEEHRHLNSFIAALDLIINYNVTSVLIGDSIAKLTTLNYINDFLENKIINIPAKLETEYEHMYNKVYTVRRDPSYSVVRLGLPRVANIEVNNNNARIKGAITIENKLAGRYSGEVNIHKISNNSSPRSNIIGYIEPSYVDVADYINNYKIRFVKA